MASRLQVGERTDRAPTLGTRNPYIFIIIIIESLVQRECSTVKERRYLVETSFERFILYHNTSCFIA